MLETMRDSAYYSIITLEDFKRSIKNLYGSPTVTYNPDFPTSSLADGQWGWDSNGEFVHIKDNATVPGYAGFTIPSNLYVGDVIEVEVEFFSISGVLPKISIDRIGAGTIDHLQLSQAGKWETMKCNFLVRTNGKYNLIIGTWASDVAEFRMRNVRVRVKSSARQLTQKDNYRTAFIVKNADGTWNAHPDYASDPCTVTVDTDKKWLNVVFTNPLLSAKDCMNFIGNEAYPSENLYMSRTYASYKDRAYICFYGALGKERVDPSTLPVGTRFSILLIGSLNSFV